MRNSPHIPLRITRVNDVVRLLFSYIMIATATLACLSVNAQDSASRPEVSPQGSNDITALHNTFWKIKHLDGFTTDVPDVVISIIPGSSTGGEEHGTITFSTATYWIFFGYYHDSNGIKCFPAYGYNFTQARQAGKIFENELLKIASYEFNKSLLTMMDKERHPLIVLSALQQKGVENQRWRIVEYFGNKDKTTQNDALIEAKVQADIVLMNGRVFGSPGMGQWVGTYAVSGNILSFDAGFTFAGIPSLEEAKQTRLVVKALRGDRRIEQKDDHILLRDKSGKAQILLVPF